MKWIDALDFKKNKNHICSRLKKKTWEIKGKFLEREKGVDWGSNANKVEMPSEKLGVEKEIGNGRNGQLCFALDIMGGWDKDKMPSFVLEIFYEREINILD